MVRTETVNGVVVLTISNSNSSPLWQLGPLYIPPELEYEDDEKLVRWAKQRWPSVKLLIQLTQDGGRTGILPLDIEGRLLTEEGGDKR